MWEWFKSLFKAKQPDVVDEGPEVIEGPLGKLVIVKAGFEEDGQIRIEVDYDDQFVRSLRERGYVGDDHSVVMKYISDVYRTILDNNNIKFD